MWAVTLHLLENYSDEIKDADFLSRVIQMATCTVSASEESTPLPVYLAVLRGLERLLLVGVLSKSDADTLIKLSIDR